MTKLLAIFLVMAVVSMFYPFRDLYVREDVFSPNYQLVKKGFWTRDACIEAATAQEAEDFRCSKRTMMGSFLGTSAKYNQSSAEGVE